MPLLHTSLLYNIFCQESSAFSIFRHGFSKTNRILLKKARKHAESSILAEDSKNRPHKSKQIENKSKKRLHFL